MEELFQWPTGRPAQLRDGLTTQEVVEALDAPVGLRLDNRAPQRAATFLAVCAPTGQQRLIVVVCSRPEPDQPWTIVGAREASMTEREMWGKYTS